MDLDNVIWARKGIVTRMSSHDVGVREQHWTLGCNIPCLPSAGPVSTAYVRPVSTDAYPTRRRPMTLALKSKR
jgi:hypothetical protein